MNSILITGCNRGIGFGLVKYLSENRNLKYIFATCRQPNEAKTLQEIAGNHKSVKILKLDLKDIGDGGSLKDVVNEVSSLLKDEGLNVLVNNAGVSTKFCRLGQVKFHQLEENFAVNAAAPVILAQAFAPLIKKSNSLPAGVIVNISSVLGSIEQNTTGGYYPYRMSKAALNAATRSISCDLKDKNILAISLHPGWLKTSMGGPQAPLSVDAAVPDIIKFIETLTPEKNGLFYSYDGKQLPW